MVSKCFTKPIKMTCWVVAPEKLKKVGLHNVVIVIEGFVDAYSLKCYATVDLSSFQFIVILCHFQKP